MTETAEKPGIDEIYITANNSSNLRLNLDPDSPRSAADVMVAAGWSQSRVGMALLRLHSEWTACAKPRRQGRAAIEAIAATIREDDARAKAEARRRGAPCKTMPSPTLRAQALADRWYVSELRLLAVGLKSRHDVWAQMEIHGKITNTPADVVAAALLHWLSPTCPLCDGHGLRKVPDQPALSARQCHKCHGSGHLPHPSGSARVLSYIDECCQKARQSMKKRFYRD